MATRRTARPDTGAAILLAGLLLGGPGVALEIDPPADLASPPAEAETCASGLVSLRLAPGRGGEPPAAADRVVVHYTGWTTDGKMFDSSVMRGEPAAFALTEVIRGWTEGFQLMVPGEKRRLWIPQRLAYRGEAGKPAGMLVFDVELIAIDEY
jgi:peptidylprolyl isomerase